MLSILRNVAAFGLLLSIGTALPQAPNTMDQYDPNDRTASYNASYAIIPIKTSVAAELVAPYKLLPVPNDKTLFPHGFPKGMHPFLVSSGYQNDIRITFEGQEYYIKALLSAGCYIPYVDRLGNGKTAFQTPIGGWLNGLNGNDLDSVVPGMFDGTVYSLHMQSGTNQVSVLVGTLTLDTLHSGSFMPDAAAWQALNGKVNSIAVQENEVPLPAGAPGFYAPVMEMIFETTKKPLYTPHTFHALSNQPIIIIGTNTTLSQQCTWQNCYFNQSFTDSTMRTANVTLYGKGTQGGALPTSLEGQYNNQGGYTATCELVGPPLGTTCKKAAAQSDPKASH